MQGPLINVRKERTAAHFGSWHSSRTSLWRSLCLNRLLKRGHEVIFYPKFHCELNFNESFWAAVKRYTRENCSYSFAELEPTVIKGLDSVPLKSIWRFAGKSMRWILSYAEKDLSPEQLAYTKMVYSSYTRASYLVYSIYST